MRFGRSSTKRVIRRDSDLTRAAFQFKIANVQLPHGGLPRTFFISICKIKLLLLLLAKAEIDATRNESGNGKA